MKPQQDIARLVACGRSSHFKVQSDPTSWCSMVEILKCDIEEDTGEFDWA